MGGAVPPLPQYAFMAWCLGGAQGTALHLPLPLPLPFNTFTTKLKYTCHRSPLTRPWRLRVLHHIPVNEMF